jgi:hypothetical protein
MVQIKRPRKGKSNMLEIRHFGGLHGKEEEKSRSPNSQSESRLSKIRGNMEEDLSHWRYDTKEDCKCWNKH